MWGFLANKWNITKIFCLYPFKELTYRSDLSPDLTLDDLNK